MLSHVVGILHHSRKVLANGTTENYKVGFIYPGLKTEIKNVKNSVLKLRQCRCKRSV